MREILAFPQNEIFALLAERRANNYIAVLSLILSPEDSRCMEWNDRDRGIYININVEGGDKHKHIQPIQEE